MRHYRQLNLDEQRRLYQLRQSGRSVCEAATEVGRHVSTIYRKLKRNRHLDDEAMFRGYFTLLANDKTTARRRRQLKIARNFLLAASVMGRLQAAWSRVEKRTLEVAVTVWSTLVGWRECRYATPIPEVQHQLHNRSGFTSDVKLGVRSGAAGM
ncbi:helix-turn-helix domain-containing protein [Sphingomonas sp. 22176]|uniref:helix-turn-helix domain-containing protein n=1 Tax=Sphingomonas sp. 22176 TaxID=3453884 RepID=UPI003F8801F2